MNFETFEMDEVGQLYSSETGEPYLVMCNGVGGYATAMISMGTEAGIPVCLVSHDGYAWTRGNPCYRVG